MPKEPATGGWTLQSSIALVAEGLMQRRAFNEWVVALGVPMVLAACLLTLYPGLGVGQTTPQALAEKARQYQQRAQQLRQEAQNLKQERVAKEVRRRQVEAEKARRLEQQRRADEEWRRRNPGVGRSRQPLEFPELQVLTDELNALARQEGEAQQRAAQLEAEAQALYRESERQRQLALARDREAQQRQAEAEAQALYRESERQRQLALARDREAQQRQAETEAQARRQESERQRQLALARDREAQQRQAETEAQARRQESERQRQLQEQLAEAEKQLGREREQHTQTRQELHEARQLPHMSVSSLPPASQDLQATIAMGKKYVQQMLKLAKTAGGVYHEDDIRTMKRQLEGLGRHSPVDAKAREQGRVANAQGLHALKEGHIAEALRAFQAAYQANPVDVEIINNLGYAYLLGADVQAAEQLLLQALVFAPGRTSAWANLGQTYAKQGDLGAAVACFAHAYRFSRNRDTTRQFLHNLAQDTDARVRDAAKQSLQLQLVQTQ